MEISQVQYEHIADCFPVHRGNVTYDNLKVLNAILYVLENGCKWRYSAPLHLHFVRLRWAPMFSANF